MGNFWFEPILTWGPVTTDGADVFAEWQWCARGLRWHLHHAIDAQRWLDILSAADWVHWRVQLERRNTNTHVDRSQNSPHLITDGIIHPITQVFPIVQLVWDSELIAVVYFWQWRQEFWIKTWGLQTNLRGVTSWPIVPNKLENSGSEKIIMASDGQDMFPQTFF